MKLFEKLLPKNFHLRSPVNILDIHEKLAQRLYLWPKPDTSMHRNLMFVLFLEGLSGFCPEVSFVLKYRKEPAHLARGVGEFLFGMSYYIKMINLILRRKHFLEILADVRAQIRSYQIFNEDKIDEIIRDSYRRNYLASSNFLKIFMALAVNYTFSEPLYALMQHFVFGHPIEEWPKVAEFEYFFNYHRNIPFYIGFIIVTGIIILHLEWSVLLFLATEVSLIDYNAVIFELLGVYFEILDHKFHDGTITYDEYSKGLKVFVGKHNDAIRLVGKLEDMLNIPLIITFTIKTVALCFIAFYLTTVKVDMTVFFKLFSLFCFTIIELYVFSYAGDKLMDRAGSLADIAYNTKFYMLPIPMQKNFIFIIARGQKKVAITAGKFYDITLNSFINAISAAASYFTLLKTVYLEE